MIRKADPVEFVSPEDFLEGKQQDLKDWGTKIK